MSALKKSSDDIRTSIYRVGISALFIAGLTLFCKALGYSLIIPLLLFLLGFHLKFSDTADARRFLHLGLLLVLAVFAAHTISTYSDFSIYYVPVPAVGLLTMLLFNSRRLAFVMSFAASTLVSLILNGGFEMMLTFLMGSLVGAYSVREARTRGQLILAGLFIAVMQVVCILLMNPRPELLVSKPFFDQFLLPLFLNGFICAFIVAATLKIFEYLFGVLTNFSLLELSDFNQPLLKRMIMEAPGTYHHSLVVSNLAEAAADAIGAHALLTRVGAYYHDIGKMVKPEYFTENQMMGSNKHDNIEPSMSRLVILNHVKEGIELAKKNNLNPALIDFIPQHHGTSLIYYFYQKSVEEAADGEVVDEDIFRYPGPKPQSRETAITLLADSVEGATRALDDPNPSNIEMTVKKVVNNKFIDGQLDECPLTLKEIEKISSTFIRILTAMYHGRVKYPEKKNGADKTGAKKNRSAFKDGNRHNRSAEEAPAQDQQHPDERRDDPPPSENT
ncbi:MAG: HDIG domain-containing protein [Candidatus Omnitrophica bacterium]|nr:HDIG domain-containing protein [Candidatus Omnitrophota bacterium]